MLISFVYLPPEGSDYSTNDSLSEIELTLLPYLETCKYFYMMGDLNARTGTSLEYAEFSLDHVATEQYGIDDDVISYLNNAQELRNYGIECARKSKDNIRNNFGNKLLQICRNNNLYICNGRINGDITSAYTCIIGSVIGYLIANVDSVLLLNRFTVHDYSALLSDVHCALSFVVNVYSNYNKTENNTEPHKMGNGQKRFFYK